MIISHKLKVIFIKTKKVAGTSFEIALSKYCGESDIITPISDDDEQIRKDMGYISARNYEKSEWNIPNLRFIESEPFFNHMDALSIKNLIPFEIWDNYLKISIVRDPCEVIISRFFYDHSFNPFELKNLPQSYMPTNDGQPVKLPTGVISFKDYVYGCSDKILSENNNITHINGVNVIDYMIKYENLQQDITLLEKKINAPGLYQTFSRMNAKGNIRPHNATVDVMFTDELKDYVQKKARLTAG